MVSLADVKGREYVKTRAYHEGLKILTEHKVLGIIGSAGDGKTTLSKMIANQFIECNKQYTPLLIDEPSDLKEVNFEDDKYLIVVDDMYGKYNTLKERKNQWPKQFDNFRIRKEKGQLVFIYITRDYIYNSSQRQLKEYDLFSTKTELKLHSDEFSLNYNEKEEILQFYKVHKDKISSILKNDKYFGFPAIASSVGNITFEQLPTNSQSSHEFMLLQLEHFWDENKDIYTALSMVFCLHKVPMGDLDRPNNEVNKIITAIKGEIYRKFEISIARDKVTDLSETFIRIFEENFMKMVSLQDFFEVPFLSHFSQKFIKMALEFCPFEMLMTVISINPADQCNCIVIDNFDELSSRFIMELRDENSVILTHSAFLDIRFLSRFLNNKDININDILRNINDLSLGDINAIEESGHFLHYVSLYGDIDCLEKILRYFQDNLPELVDKKTKFGWDAISLAVISKIKPIEKIDVLLKALKYDDLVTLPHFVVYSSDFNVIEHVAAKHTNFDIRSLDNKSRTILHNACDSIHDVSDIINFLVKRGFDLNAKDKDGCTALHLAAGRGKTETVSILIKNGASVFERDNKGRLPSHAACAAQGGRNDINSHGVLVLLTQAECPVIEPDHDGRTPFLEALAVVNTKCLQYFIENLTRLEIQDELRQPFLIDALMLNDFTTFRAIFDILILGESYIDLIDVNMLIACVDSVEKFKYLLVKGANFNVVDDKNHSVLHHACRKGAMENVNYLVNDAKVDVNHQDNDGLTPAVYCCLSEINPVDKLMILSSNGGDLYTVDNSNHSLLHHACWFGTTETVKYLVNDVKFDVNHQDIDGRTPAVYCSRSEINPVDKLMLLSSNGGDLYKVDNSNRSLLHSACWSGTTETVKYLVNNVKLDVNHQDNDGRTPAVYCCLSEINPVDKLMLLSSNGGDLYTVDNSNRSLLHHACWFGTTETVKYLVNDVKFDVNHQDIDGRTPAVFCCKSKINPVDKLMLLSSNGGDLYTVDNSNHSLLHHACWFGTTETVKYLVNDVKFDVNHQDIDGRTPAVFCCKSKINPVDKLMLLSSNGGDLYTVDNSNRSLLHHACWFGTTETVKYLVNDVKFDVNHQDIDGRTPAVFCCKSKINPVDKLMLLSSNGGDLYTVDNSNRSLLHHACWFGTTETVKYLVNDVKFDVNHQDIVGRTPAVYCSRSEINPVDKLMILSSNGGDLYTVDNSNHSLLHHACWFGTTETVKYLVNDVKFDVNHQDIDGRTPAVFCCKSKINPVDKLMLLSSNGGDLYTVDNSNRSLLHHACWFGTTETVKYLVNDVKFDVNHQDIDGRTPAVFCCKSKINPVDKLMLLSSNGGDLYTVDNSNRSLLHHACWFGTTETVKYLVNDVKFDVNHQDIVGRTPAVYCSRSEINPVDKLMILSSNGGDLYTVDNSNHSLLHHACWFGTTETVKYLVNDVKFDVNHQDIDGRTPAVYCSWSEINPVDKLMLLSSNGGDLYTVDNSNCSLLHSACWSGTTETVKYLVNNVKLDVNHQDNDGRTPAVYCCLSEINPVDKLMLLSSNGGDLYTVDNSNRSLLHHACWFGTTETVKYLVNDVKFDVNHQDIDGRTPAVYCSRSEINPVDKLMLLSSNGGDLYKVDNSNCSLLHHACEYGTTETVKYLVNNVKLDVNHQDNDGRTPAVYCCLSEINPVDKLMLLSSNGGDLYTVDNSNRSLLHHACWFGTTETVKYLVNDVKFDVNHQDIDGRTPAVFCCKSKINPVDKLMLLSSNGGDLYTVDNSNRSLLHHACWFGTTETVKYLVNDVKFDVNHQDIDGRTPAVFCCKSKINPVDKLMLLSSNGGDLYTVDNSNRSLLHHACWFGTTETVKYLVNDVKFDVNHQDIDGRTPAVYCSRSEINPVDKLMLLSSNGGDLYKVDNSNCSLLHHACEYGTTETVKYLVNNVKLEVNHQDNDGRTPAVYCSQSEITPVDKLMLLSSNGGDLYTVDNSNCSLLHHACEYGTTETVKYLVNNVKLEVNHQDNDGRTPAVYCSQSEITPVDKLMLLSSNGGDLYTVHNSNCSLLHHACEYGTTETVKYLVNNVKLEVNYQDNEGRTPAGYCSQSEINPVDKLMLLSSNGGDLYTVDNSNCSLLHHACDYGTTETVKYLVNNLKFDVNHQDNDGRTPAVYCSQSEITPVDKLMLLSSNGGDLYTVHNSNCSLLHHACEYGTTETVKYLVNNVKLEVNHQDNDGRTPAVYCSQSEITPVDKLMLLSSNGGDLYTVDNSNCSLLHHACEYGTTETVKYLVNNVKLEVNHQDNDGRTPAVYCSQSEITPVDKLMLLSSNGGDLYTVDNSNCSLLHHACEYGTTETVKYLVNNVKLEVNHQDNDGRTPAVYCSQSEITPVDKLMLLSSNGGDLYTVDNSNCSLLHHACEYGTTETVKYLVNNVKLEVNHQDNDGRTPAGYCNKSKINPVDKLMLLSSNGGDLYTVNNNNCNLLHGSCAYGTIETVKYLVNVVKLDIHRIDNDNDTPLLCCFLSEIQQLEKIIFLISTGAKITICRPYKDILKDEDDYDKCNYLLHHSCYLGTLETVKYLVNDAGYDINYTDNDNMMTALLWCFKTKIGQKDKINFLLSKGAKII
ncbi:hypothetical protein SNE40_001737 [Patella caerulea]|uniref:Novel STAND NTPase 3 domain-containing protein n=1 Tax=Patella caerulea TaxID=87958 RepID=A0AAN8PY56_PATCE